MSKYTTEVRFICESKAGLSESTGCDNVDDIISKSWDKIFTSKAVFFDEKYRSVLCQKILKHYYLREIGSETVGIWKLWLNTRLEEIMPLYNQLYKSALIEFNPLYDVDLKRTHNRKIDSSKQDTGTSQSVSSGEINASGTSRGSSNNGTANSLEDYVENVSGKQGSESYSSMLLKFRETFLNIDMQVIEEFSDLFMGLW